MITKLNVYLNIVIIDRSFCVMTETKLIWRNHYLFWLNSFLFKILWRPNLERYWRSHILKFVNIGQIKIIRLEHTRFEVLDLLSVIKWVHNVSLQHTDFELDSKRVVDCLFWSNEDISDFDSIIFYCRHFFIFSKLSWVHEFILRQVN